MSAPIRFIHCADLHLGSRFVGITVKDPELGKKMRSSTFDALDEIVNKAMHEAVDFIVFSGDIFDDSNETPYTRHRFVDAVARAGVPCYIVFGNHDYKRRWSDSIPLPPNAYVFGPEPERMFFPPKSLDAPIEIIGVSYNKRHVHEDMGASIKGSEDRFSIGVLHCDLDAEKSPYSPCRSSDLAGRNIDYWALGHVHKAGIVSKDPYIVYPGNTQGRNPRESGEKGAFIVTVSDRRVVRTEFFETAQILWKDVEVSIGRTTTLPQLIEDIASKTRPGWFVRVRVTGSGRLDSRLRTGSVGRDGDSIERSETVIGLIEEKTGCVCTGLEIMTSPDIDIKKRMDTGDFLSEAIKYGTTLQSATGKELIDIICSWSAMATLRSRFEDMPYDELRRIVDDSVKLIVAKMGEER